MWPCYRLVLERYVTWSDLEQMSLDDVDLLNIAADDWLEAERNATGATSLSARRAALR